MNPETGFPMMCDRANCYQQKVVPARNIRQVIFSGTLACVFADTVARAGCERSECAQQLQYSETHSDAEVEWLLDNVPPERTSVIDSF
ncbi:MAG: hypothetical protein ABIV43_02260 [Candidatus Saccharimonadales bacterium]